ncbi:MAG: hypothetical protein R3C19_24765 [Planctomycetaceae bacterium]
MSDRIRIQFDSDMPPASVEVVSPDLQTIRRVWLDPGQTSDVIDVPSEASFLRVHLPSGKSMIVRDPGMDIRRVGMATQDRSIAEAASALTGESVPIVNDVGPEPQMRDGTRLALTSDDHRVEGVVRYEGREVLFHEFPDADAFILRAQGESWILNARLPGRLRSAVVQLHERETKQPTLRIRIATDTPQADVLAGYMARGDYYSAAAMVDWIDRAEEMLLHKTRDPNAAAVGAYLLLRLRRFDLMRDWAGNLAKWWPKLADGAIIRAWQLIHQRRAEAEIEDLLRTAAEVDPPVFTQGLKLLDEGLRLITKHGDETRLRMEQKLGSIQWSSPFTASVWSKGDPPPPLFQFGYLADA